MKLTFIRVAETLLKVIEARDASCAAHSRKVALLAKIISGEMGMTLKMQEYLYLAGLFHDIGKVGIKDSYLSKPGKLSPAEWVEIKKHPVIGCEIIKTIPGSQDISLMVLYHHERYDGKGYPAGLQGEAIPLGARILAVVDAFDAMVADRIYRPKLEREAAIAELMRCSGSHFDPSVVEVFCRVLPGIKV
ncbi:MAG: Cyclic di-GMP phosphodiesterase response regulator RpfG [Pelotomaculum sp. PtaB.Bin013]|uniref:HD-GYP domain-containing protein n=1 Tax=Pelotomaculum isophthalicicum JI TaxID=947010 RepID=A0A9X4H1W8_9FIRM|nr:HD-GYP domain-containing protein [Pelotomaculum isophthalicicum]MDF9408496.1 HD-GYP domain-containing protein [Pelotomaculum isophthalicicum JI]OPX89624.1 MAG: Cyclic di-GMP phosphodiesterase response regulator RpfG [Pelotomaculum sp. PtaB.Bin013]